MLFSDIKIGQVDHPVFPVGQVDLAAHVSRATKKSFYLPSSCFYLPLAVGQPLMSSPEFWEHWLDWCFWTCGTLLGLKILTSGLNDVSVFWQLKPDKTQRRTCRIRLQNWARSYWWNIGYFKSIWRSFDCLCIFVCKMVACHNDWKQCLSVRGDE